MSAGAADRPLRADARRNRERLLEVAEAVFTEKGTGASTEEIARRAGVGIGTVFRHFPTKEALLAAVYARLLRRLGESAVALAGHDDPGAAFYDFVTLVADRASAKNAFADALTEAGVEVPHPAPAQGGDGGEWPLLGDALGTLLHRAQEAGAVRGDIGLPELRAILIGVSRAVEYAPADEPATRAHVVAVLLDGLRPGR